MYTKNNTISNNTNGRGRPLLFLSYLSQALFHIYPCMTGFMLLSWVPEWGILEHIKRIKPQPLISQMTFIRVLLLSVFLMFLYALWNECECAQVLSFQNIKTNLRDYEPDRNDKHQFGLIMFQSDLQLGLRLSGGQFKNGHPMIISQDWKGGQSIADPYL